MTYATRNILLDAAGRPIPQMFNRAEDEYEPLYGQEGGLNIATLQRKFRSDFIGANGSPPNPEKWQVVQTGAGMTVDILNNELRVVMGTTANAETIIRSVEDFSIAMIAKIGYMLSQRIANNETHFEFVSIDETTGLPDNDSAAGWQFDATTPTNGKYRGRTGANELLSAAVTTTTSASRSIAEIELFADESWFHTRGIDSTAQRSQGYVRHQNLPDPNRRYKFQIRVKNGAVAPATSTTLTVPFVSIIDYAELHAEVTAGRGGAAAGQAMPVFLTGGAPTSAPTTAVTLTSTTAAAPAATIAGATVQKVQSAATTNAAIVKASAGRVLGWQIANNSAGWRYVRLYNLATLPVVGTTVPLFVIAIPPGGKSEMVDLLPISFAAGIGIAITAAAPDLDATATAVDEVIGALFYV